MTKHNPNLHKFYLLNDWKTDIFSSYLNGIIFTVIYNILHNLLKNIINIFSKYCYQQNSMHHLMHTDNVERYEPRRAAIRKE